MKHFAIAWLLACGAVPALACGACAEDKVAATYDHASVRDAVARGKVVVYCDLAGTRDFARVRAAASRLAGVDGRSVRVSQDNAALSFVLDAKRQSPRAAVTTLQAALGEHGRVALLKVEGAGASP